jgi:hypothetical protein
MQFLEMGVPRHRGTGAQPIVRDAVPIMPAHDLAGQAVKAQDAVGATVQPDVGNSLWPRTGNRVHTLCTSNGSPYTNFQSRIMYGTYKLTQAMPGGDVLAAFTRILHRSVNDELMQVHRSGPPHSFPLVHVLSFAASAACLCNERLLQRSAAQVHRS